MEKANTGKTATTIYVIIIIVLLSACNFLKFISRDRPDSSPETEPNEIMADCFISFEVAAWEDLNGDGVWDMTEHPLEGVEFTLQGPFAHQFDPNPIPAKGDGWFSILVWSPGDCIEQDYTLSAVPPETFEPTTPTVVTFSYSSQLEAQFGFRAISQ